MKKIILAGAIIAVISAVIFLVVRHGMVERKWEKAEKRLEEALKLNPRDANTYVSLGRLYEYTPKESVLKAQKKFCVVRMRSSRMPK